MAQFGALTGRRYGLFEYEGTADAERALVLMGSGAETARQTVMALVAKGAKAGVLQVRLYRPFSAADFLAALPASVTAIAVLEQTKEPGSTGEPLYLDVVATLAEAVARGERGSMPRVVSGRYGISSKDFTPAMAKAALDELLKRDANDRFAARTASPSGSTTTCLMRVSRSIRVSRSKPTASPARSSRSRRRRNGRGQQEQRENHRRGCRALRSRLLRLQFSQIGRPDHFAPPVSDRIRSSLPI